METSKHYNHKEACPACRANNQDTRGDNLHRYQDGHGHCFACNYHESAPGIEVIVNMVKPKEEKEYKVVLPNDATHAIDYKALQWLSKYEITSDEVKDHNFLWSPSRQFLVFPIYGETNSLLGWQARCFAPDSVSRYFTVGMFSKFFHIINGEEGKGDDLILVEDILSAIKVGRQFSTMPLFGSHLSVVQLNRLKSMVGALTFWLDEDKIDKSMMLAKQASQLGFKTKIVCTKHDPKEYNDEEIYQTLVA